MSGPRERETMLTADSAVRSRYLALALDARRILDLLVPFVECGQRGQALDTSVKDVIEALQSLDGPFDIKAIHGRLAFDEYEQVMTLDEVRTAEGRKGVISDLEAILETDNLVDNRIAATRVLHFLFALESRALHHYRSPSAPAFA